MAVIGTFGSFTTARLALYASQGSLNVTGNNIANINTEGYTRQRMDLVSLNATGQAKYANSFMVDVGYGVLCDRTTQLRDPFLDIRYRDKNSQLGQVEQWQNGLDQLASVLDEVNRGKDDFGIIENQLNDFHTQLQNLLTKVGTDEYDDLVRASGTTLCQLLNVAYEDVEKIQQDEEKLLKEQVDKANVLLDQIRDLNKQIREHSIYGDSALELRDARNVALDELSSLMHINVEYSYEKLDQYTEVEKLTVTLADSTGSNGKPLKLVDGVYGTHLLMPEEVPAVNPNYPKSGGMYLTKTVANNGTVTYGSTDDLADPDLLMVDSFKEGSTENRYLFQLEALKDEKGHYMRDENNQEIKDPENVGDTVMTGGLQAIREMLTEEGVFASEDDIAMDPDATTKRGIKYYLQALDTMAATFADVMNKANQMPASVVYMMDAAGFVDKDGSPIMIDDGNGGTRQMTQADVEQVDNTGAPVLDENGDPVLRTDEEGLRNLAILRETNALNPDYDFYDGGVLFSNRSDNNDPTGITAANISISEAWLNRTVRVLNTKRPNDDLPHSTRSDNIQHIITLYEGDQRFLPKAGMADAASDKAFFIGNFQHYFTDIGATLAADGQITNAEYINYSTEALDLQNSRLSVSGVDLNDEATSMIQFSKAYSAACRLMTTLDSMLDKLINGTAV